MGVIELLDVPSVTTIQDGGRYGYQRFGVPVGGFMDEVSARLSNYLVGNDDYAPLIEFVLNGPTIKFHSAATFALGGDCEPKLNGAKIEPWRSYRTDAGDVLKVGALRRGMYGYVAFSGGILCKPILGSCSTYYRANFGTILKKGEMLRTVENKGFVERALPEELIPDYREHREIRVIMGPHLENFTPRGIETFLSSEYTVTPQSDRMGYRLEGPKIEHSEKGGEIITDAVPNGSIQVPSDGKPIVMLADRQTTGGYPKIGVVATVDIPKFAQIRAGERVRFVSINVKEAQKLIRRREGTLRGIKDYLSGKARVFRVWVNNKSFTVLMEDFES